MPSLKIGNETVHEIAFDDLFQSIHDQDLNPVDFSIYLLGIPKNYHADDADFSEPGIEYQMSSRLIKNLHLLSGLDACRPILIHMKTCGGYWEEGMAIYDAIRACSNPVTILSYTHARSMSSIVLQAATKRVLMPNSYFLFHEGTLVSHGTAKKTFSLVDWQKRIVDPTMLDIYVTSLKRRGKFSDWSPVSIRDMLQFQMDQKEDVYLTAQETVEWGFADEVFDGDWSRLRQYD